VNIELHLPAGTKTGTLEGVVLVFLIPQCQLGKASALEAPALGYA